MADRSSRNAAPKAPGAGRGGAGSRPPALPRGLAARARAAAAEKAVAGAQAGPLCVVRAVAAAADPAGRRFGTGDGRG